MKSKGLLFLIISLLCIPSLAPGKGDAKDIRGSMKILIVGNHDNVKSNFYHNGMIAEQTGIPEDSIGTRYNYIIAENIASGSGNDRCVFVPGKNDAAYDRIAAHIRVEGEGEDATSDLSQVPAEELQQALAHAGADYLLVLNQHYLKWQGAPMRTLFHIVSYTLYDKERKPVYSGNQYFTSMKLESPDKVAQLSRKTTSRIASSVARALNF